mmetsp:Transcript_53419/g.141915  ORF Transcript_53419/g.141915 Transcript_53419/m.141915 type:complete len:213 (+) Transcript_53419:390-1028(+)
MVECFTGSLPPPRSRPRRAWLRLTRIPHRSLLQRTAPRVPAQPVAERLGELGSGYPVQDCAGEGAERGVVGGAPDAEGEGADIRPDPGADPDGIGATGAVLLDVAPPRDCLSGRPGFPGGLRSPPFGISRGGVSGAAASRSIQSGGAQRLYNGLWPNRVWQDLHHGRARPHRIERPHTSVHIFLRREPAWNHDIFRVPVNLRDFSRDCLRSS